MRYLLTTLTAAAIAMSASTGYAESVADKRGLMLEGARQVIAATVDAARKADAPGGSIAVVDEGGNLLALERLDHTFAASANIAIGKARTAALFKKSTKVFEDAIKNGRTSMVTLGGDLQNFTPARRHSVGMGGQGGGSNRRQRRGPRSSVPPLWLIMCGSSCR